MALTSKEIAVLQLRSKGLTQVQVAKKLDVSQAAISDFEKNAYRKLQDAKEMLRFAKRLGVRSPESPYKGVVRE